MADHTPTPWAVPVANVFRVIAPEDPRKDERGYWRIVADLIPDAYDKEDDIGPEAAANARLIVRAVNNHVALCKALEQLLHCVGQLGEEGSAVPLPLWNALKIEAAMEAARAAIADASREW